jgi:hypothetical protein
VQPFDLVLLALATWRLAYLMVKESGPWQIMATIRAWSTFGGLLNCIYCASLWAGIAMFGLLLVFPPVVWVFAASGGAMLLWRYTGGDHV